MRHSRNYDFETSCNSKLTVPAVPPNRLVPPRTPIGQYRATIGQICEIDNTEKMCKNEIHTFLFVNYMN